MAEYDELEFAEVEVPPVLAVQVPGQCAADPASISNALKGAFGTVTDFLRSHSLTPTAPPRAIYSSYGPEGMSFIVAMPIAAAPSVPMDESGVTVRTLGGEKAYRFTHRGPYQNLMQTYGRITEFMKSKGWIQTESDWARYMPMWEEYVNGPEKTSDAELLTYIYLPAN